MGKYIKLSAEQKDEIRRLTQLANRRIKSAQKVYAKEGFEVLPKEVVGSYQIREQWNTTKTPLSRSVKFESVNDYKKQLKFLREFDPKAPGETRPDIWEYTGIQREKTMDAIETSLGEIPEGLQEKLDKMTAPQLSKFWDTFERKAIRLGGQYSSNEAMTDTLTEVFPEDKEAIVEASERFRPSTPIEYR